MRITLCGSTRFRDKFDEINAKLSLMGHVVYSCALWGHSGDELSPDQKLMLDAVHFAKIANSEAIYVINVEGYVGESTKREIMFAKAAGKKVLYYDQEYPVLEPHRPVFTKS